MRKKKSHVMNVNRLLLEVNLESVFRRQMYGIYSLGLSKWPVPHHSWNIAFMACWFNLEQWNNLIALAVPQGHNRCDILVKFLLVWAAMDGSIVDSCFEVLIPDDPEMIAFF